MQAKKTRTTQAILDAAVQLFSRHGYHGTTTQEIARLAKVNEGTIFRQFGHKIDLFWAAVHSQLDKLRMRRRLEASLSGDHRPEVVLPLMFEFLVHMVLYQPVLLRLLCFGLLELPADAGPVCRKQVAPIFDAFSSYIERCVTRGVIRRVDPVITTAALAVTAIAHEAVVPLLTGNSLPYASADEAIASYSGLWMAMLVPQNDAN